MRFFALAFALNCFLAIELAGAKPASAQTIVVTKYGDAITEDDIEQRIRLNFLGSEKVSARQDAIGELVEDMDTIREAEKSSGLDAQTNSSFLRLCSRMGMGPAQLTGLFRDNGIRLDTLRMRIKAGVAKRQLALTRMHQFQDPPFKR